MPTTHDRHLAVSLKLKASWNEMIHKILSMVDG